MLEEIFNELSRKSNTLYSIPPKAKEKKTDLLIPLTDEEKVDQYKAKL